MDVASSLVRSIVRSFYVTEHILIIDALIIHSTLRDDDLALLMGMQTKYLRKLCGRLREDGLISVHSRPEQREGAQRPFNRDYYYINFHRAIDVAKYRLKKMTREVERRFAQTPDEKKEYACPQCRSEYTLMEVLDNVGPDGRFECKRCGQTLRSIESANGAGGTSHTGHEVQSRLNAQLAAFEDLMRQIDNTPIPENDFDTALANARPVLRDPSLNPAARSEVLAGRDGAGRLPPVTVKGLRNEPEKIVVSLLDDSQAGKDLEAAAEAERRAKLAAQNALPSWHTNSTITGEKTGLGVKEEAARMEREMNGGVTPRVEGQEDDEKKKVLEDSTALNSYFAALKEEQEREARQDREEQGDGDEDEEEDDEGDDDEAEFEDVALDSGEPRSQQKRVKIQEPGVDAEEESAPPVVDAGDKLDDGGGDSEEFEDVV